MRQIKFRAKRLKDGSWIEGYYVHDIEWAKHYIYRQEQRGSFFMSVGNEVDPETVCQFTGVIDANGKEIYEGDILKYDESLTDHLEGVEYFVSYDSQGYNIETDFHPVVVGNKFDNPNLL